MDREYRCCTPSDEDCITIDEDIEADVFEPILKPSGSKEELDDLIERLMGKSAESRYQFIQDNAEFVEEIDV